ncbi:MAG: tryptophan 2,3-dioxygenase family protein [Bacteroidota bacterium]
MDKSKIDPKIVEQIKKLEDKYEVMGQDLSSYLDGLLYSDYLTYWDYIHHDTLMSLQTPKTGFKDEMIFIVYHQQTELYFKLVLWELDQIAGMKLGDDQQFLEKINRINRYFSILEDSFSVMIDGMDRKQFLKFRMSLLPSSGFQSAQYRLIELSCTDLVNLVNLESRHIYSEGDPVEQLLDNIYWKRGATELASGKKTLTLKQFEAKYSEDFIDHAEEYKKKNLSQLYDRYFQESEIKEDIVAALRKLDILINVNWPLAHYKSAVRYLQKDPEDVMATGGTNWQKYLPPRFQKVVFFPQLWSDQEKKEWGKSWVFKEVIER